MSFEFAPAMKQVFGRTESGQGEGSLLALKIALQTFSEKKPLLVFSRGPLAENAKYLGFTAIAAENPLAAARGLARASKEKVVVFASDAATRKQIKFMNNLEENIIYICLNSGYGQMEVQMAG